MAAKRRYVMFGIFRKKQKEVFNNVSDEPIDMDKVKVWYEGEVVSGDYDLNDTEDYPYHNLFPHGQGHIKYKLSGRNVEEYKGSFKGGQYNGYGILVDRYGEVFQGEFWENNFVGDL